MREDPESESVSICEFWAASSFPVVRSPVTEMFLTLSQLKQTSKATLVAEIQLVY